MGLEHQAEKPPEVLERSAPHSRPRAARVATAVAAGRPAVRSGARGGTARR